MLGIWLLDSFSNVNGNMWQSFVLLLTGLLGLCSCSSFPSNINIGEYSAAIVHNRVLAVI